MINSSESTLCGKEEQTVSDIAKIDKNFEVNTSIDKENIQFYNVNSEPFQLYGIFMENGKYRRMPEAVAKNVSEGVHGLHGNTAGGRVRFVTDSMYVAIHSIMENVGKMPHFAFTGSVGFDLYCENDFVKTFVPPCNTESGYESIIEFKEKKMRIITIHFPLYSDVKELYVGLEKDSSVTEAAPYRNQKPIIYYGSSITQGGCASRPGMSYPSIISRKFNLDYVNLGFSGNAKAEDEMIEYIKNLDMSGFVYDYDYNAPTTEHLRNTHEKMFCAIRKEKPDIPIIMMSRPRVVLTADELIRRNIIETTYRNALSRGDSNVYFLDGSQLMAICGDEGTVDGCHPTDFGFASMANAVSTIVEKCSFL